MSCDETGTPPTLEEYIDLDSRVQSSKSLALVSWMHCVSILMDGAANCGSEATVVKPRETDHFEHCRA